MNHPHFIHGAARPAGGCAARPAGGCAAQPPGGFTARPAGGVAVWSVSPTSRRRQCPRHHHATKQLTPVASGEPADSGPPTQEVTVSKNDSAIVENSFLMIAKIETLPSKPAKSGEKGWC